MSHQSELISTDIDAYLAQHEQKELLRFLTCGNVDDGKSTLIGRLLHDSKMIYEDQLEAIKSDSIKSGTTGGEIDLALLVDGLQAEREQGITIDVAYRYFSTAKRKFIIADTPGHEQYTRNMATGASTCDLAVILIDARHGVQTQTKRHSFITSLLGIKHTVIAINKMDLVDYSEARFEEIKHEFQAFAAGLNMKDLHFVPLSALKGDNVVSLSDTMPWYRDQPLMEILETVEIAADRNFDDLRFPVQYVNRPNLDFRGYCGTLASGIVRPGDEITVLPSGKNSKVKSIVTWDGDLDEAFAPMSVTLTLEDEIDVSRGDMIVHSHKVPAVINRFNAHLVWMNEAPLKPGKEYLVKIGTTTVTGRVSNLDHKIDVNTLEETRTSELALNEIALCELTLDRAVVCDDYRHHPGTGSFIVIDRLSNLTVGAGMIAGPAIAAKLAGDEIHISECPLVTQADRALRFGQQHGSLYLTGADEQARLSAAYSLEKVLFDQGRLVAVISDSDALESIDATAALLEANGFIVLIATAESDATQRVAVSADNIAASVKQGYDQLQQAGLL
ncbi:sulfate adenylyltransferase subunit CysN [Motiliproteus sediminis]|uniref:sulfate adenylyltransferase subunit CysN n=1 Tax=Motiliproteus sediminis TaxID=1468178 RepID=UPI001AEFE1F5|nr:sulfate adenylyltransferase subunit CysN [Motiliproteus sediminis]